MALRFSNVTPGSYLDITTEATNQTGVTWTSWGSRTAALEPAALPPVHGTFFASREGFFTQSAFWRGVPEAVFARCNEVTRPSSAARPKETCSRHITAQSLRAKR